MTSYMVLIPVLFMYGLVLFAMGLAIILEIRRANASPIAGSLWWLAGFGLLHSCVEWLQILQLLDRNGLDVPASEFIPLPFLFLLVISGFMLAQFGASMLASGSPKWKKIRWVPLSLLSLWLLVMWSSPRDPWMTDESMRFGNIMTRYVLYVPGTVLATLGLLKQRAIFREMGFPWIARDCTWGAVAFALKGLFAAISVPAASFFPASIFNSSSFVAVLGVPSAVFRALAAVVITYFVLKVLRLFEIERQQELKRVSHQLKQLSVQILNAQEEERKRIARELHDDTAQLLSSLLLQLKMLQRAVSLDEVRNKSNLIVELVAQASNSVRRMAYELRPAALEDLGLPAALRWYSERLAMSRGLSVEVESSGLRSRLSAQTELGLYRVVQEALINAAKHSGAQKARVKLEQQNGILHVTIEDDGLGFDVKEATSSWERGLGLFGMQERVSLLGGSLHIDSQPKLGTRVLAKIPVENKVAEEDEDKSPVSR